MKTLQYACEIAYLFYNKSIGEKGCQLVQKLSI